MRMRREHSLRDFVRYAEGEVTRSEAEEFERRLANNPAATEQLHRIKQWTTHLKEIDRDLENIDLVPQVRQAIAALPPGHLNFRNTAKRNRFIAVGAIAASLIAVIGLSTFLLNPWKADLNTENQAAGLSDHEFRAKSDDPESANRDKWCGISPFLVRKHKGPVPLGKHLRLGDELGFSYTNIGKNPFRFLMIFAVDANGAIFWYYPAYTEQGSDPWGKKIRGGKGVRDLRLPEVVHHAFKPGSLMIYGLFTDKALKVSTVEEVVGKKIKEDPNYFLKPNRLPIGNFKHIGQHIIETKVTR